MRGMEILAEPSLSLTAFRFAPEGMSAEDTNDLNRRILADVNARQNVYMTGTMLGDRFALRICVLSFRTHSDRMEQAIQDLRDAVESTAVR